MAERIQGPTCASKLGKGWIDQGTHSRTRSGGRGLPGMVMSLILGATPAEDEEASQRKAEDQVLIGSCIDVIAKSPFGKSAAGKPIVKLLRSLNLGGRIQYGGTIEGSRGDWDGSTIRIDEGYRGNMNRTIPELVHEAAHALWKKSAKAAKDEAARRKDNIDDELRSREYQLIIYKYLRDDLHWPPDPVLERRLELQAAGKLRQAIEENYGGPHD
jgi:hypothetical protein